MKVEFKEVSKSFGSLEVLKDINLEIPSNQFISIIGPSGCGKTTLLKMVNHLSEPTGGEILIDGERVTGPHPEVNMVFQSFQLYPWRTVLDNVSLGLEIEGMGKQERYEIANRWIEIVGLDDFEDHYPYELSGGMKQRVGLARALATDPEVLLMDEPFGALDAQTKDQMQTELLRLLEEREKTIIFVTHDIEEAIYLSDRVIALSTKPASISYDEPIDFERPRWTRRIEVENTDQFARVKSDLRQELGLDPETDGQRSATETPTARHDG